MKTNRTCPMYSWERPQEDAEEERMETSDGKTKILLRRQAIGELGQVLGKIVTNITNISNVNFSP